MNKEIKAKLYQTILNTVEYQKYDENGKALGCMLPIYMTYPEGNNLKFDFPSGNTNMKEYMLNLFDQYCEPVDILNDLQEGDILAINVPFGLFHVGIYLGGNDIIHCTQKSGMELISLTKYRSRIERGYRYKWQQQ